MATGLYLGLSGLVLEKEAFELGKGITIRKTFAHLMAPYMVAFVPVEPGQARPAPWKSARGGSGYDIVAELFVPDGLAEGEAWELQRTLTFLLRAGVNPATTATAFASHSFSELQGVPDTEAQIMPIEAKPRIFQLIVHNARMNEASAKWVADRWEKTHRLIGAHKEFDLGVAAIEAMQFEKNGALSLMSLWAALEAMFSRERSELRFRVSSYIAAYLKPFGPERLELQKKLGKLYDKRSATAHGAFDIDHDALFETVTVMRQVLLRMIDASKVPTREDLEERLFG